MAHLLNVTQLTPVMYLSLRILYLNKKSEREKTKMNIENKRGHSFRRLFKNNVEITIMKDSLIPEMMPLF